MSEFTELDLDGSMTHFSVGTHDFGPIAALDEWRFGTDLHDVMVSADYDGDGDVDGSDFLKWQRSEVSTPPSAADLALWEDQFGTTSVLSLLATVPEPSSIAILLAVFACGLLWQRHT